MPKIYCGVNKLKKNQKYGTPNQCYKRGQVRLYGYEVLDVKLIKKLTGSALSMSNTDEEKIDSIVDGLVSMSLLNLIKDRRRSGRLDPDWVNL